MPQDQSYRILYFSGTGNTEWVMHRIEERLIDAGASCQTSRVDQLLADHGMGPESELDADGVREDLAAFLTGATHLLLGYPVYESTIPMPMRLLMDLLPEGRGMKLGVVCTFMMAGGDCCHLPERALESRGYQSVLATYVKMPNNIKFPIVRFLHIPQGDELLPFYDSAIAAVAEIVNWLREGKTHVEGRGIADYLFGVSQRWGEEAVTRYVCKNIFALACCNRCRLCAESCPVGNISFANGYPEFGDRCCDCLRCYHQCPQQAIQITAGTMDEETYPRYKGFDGWKAPRLRKVTRKKPEAESTGQPD